MHVHSMEFVKGKDSSSILVDVDRALRTGNIGAQCEAIIQCSRLLLSSSDPLVVNATLLKLADHFRARFAIFMLVHESHTHTRTHTHTQAHTHHTPHIRTHAPSLPNHALFTATTSFDFASTKHLLVHLRN